MEDGQSVAGRESETSRDADASTIPLSVCVITQNEEDNIQRCLSTVQWADEIVVVDSGSEDRTPELAEEMGARVLHHEWAGHVQQKQFATDRASHDWVLSVDADEALSPTLQQAVKRLFEDGPPPSSTCFRFNRLSYYLGDWIHHGSWHPDWIIRLFHRGQTEWGGQDPHDRVRPTERVVSLDGLLYHYPYEDLSDHLAHINDYTDTMAREHDRKNVRGSVTKAVLHGGFKFFKDLILKRGFLDGGRGVACAVTGGFYTFMKYLKLWERQNVDSSEPGEFPSADFE